MAVELVDQLRKTLAQLETQNAPGHTIGERRTLHRQLSSTIRLLHDYPGEFNQHEQQRLLGMLMPLEQQLLDGASVSSHATWHNIRNTLHSVITRALALFA